MADNYTWNMLRDILNKLEDIYKLLKHMDERDRIHRPVWKVEDND